MRPLKIDCSKKNWKALLKRNLQDGIEVNLLDLNYSMDAPFCEMLAMADSTSVRLDTRDRIAKLRKPPPAAPLQVISPTF